MAELNKEEMLHIVEENIKKIEDKDFNVYFFVLDTKGNPSGSLEYIYETALTLFKLGYKVTMIHQEKEFIGAEEWLGSKYNEIPHKNVETDNVEIGPCDFLFIPEIFANVMGQTKTLPCKRVIILQNYNFLCEFMPVGATPFDMNINDVITTSESQKKIIEGYFPGIRTHIVKPCIKNIFRHSNNPQKLIVNIVSKSQHDVNRIVKPFYWKYPIYKWVSFRDLRSVSQDVFANALKEAALTIWIDESSCFGYSALEAMRSGTILLAKIPNKLTDWNIEENEKGKTLTNACIWFDDLDDLPDMIASIVRTWTLDEIPEDVYESEKKFDKQFTHEQQEEDIEKVYVEELFNKRKNEFEEVLIQLKNNGLDLKKK